MATWKIQFTPSGGGAVTLADMSATPQNPFQWDALPGDSIVEKVPMFNAANPKYLPLGNAGDELSFRTWQSYADIPTAAADYKAKQALINSVGTLVMTLSSTTLTWSNAVCKSMKGSPGEIEGVRWVFRWLFEVGSVS